MDESLMQQRRVIDEASRSVKICREGRKRGERTGLDTLVVHAVNDDNQLLGSNAFQWRS